MITHRMNTLTAKDSGLCFSFGFAWVGHQAGIALSLGVTVTLLMLMVIVRAATTELDQSHAHGPHGPDPHGVRPDRQ